jgi:hypothetical protein
MAINYDHQRDRITSTSGIITVNTTGAIAVPVGNTAQRPGPATGQLRFNTQTASFEGYDGTSWGQIGVTDVVSDTTPQLGGNLDINGKSIVSTSNANIILQPNGTGKVSISGILYPTTDGTANQILTTDGNGNITFANAPAGYADEDVDTHLNLSSATSGQALVYDGTDYSWSTVGGAITVQEEGVSLATAATTINFVGSSVTASGTGATKTITIVGAGAGGGIGFSDLSVGAEGVASGNGDLSYNSATGVFTFTPPTLSGIGGTTDDITEGTTKLFYTQAKFNAAFTAKDTNDLSEGTTNLYYTAARDSAQFDIDLATKNTNNLSEGTTNLYYTNARAQTVIDTNTAGFITDYTVTESDVTQHQAALSITESQISDLAHYTNTDWDTQLATKSTTDLAEGSNLYYTDTRARAAISENSIQLSYNNATGVFSYTQGDTDTVAEGSTNLYYTEARTTQNFNNNFATKTTSDLTEGTNLYYTNARVDTHLGSGNVQDIVVRDISARDVDISGDLNVSGTTTTVNQATLSVADSKIFLAVGNNTDFIDIGTIYNYNDGLNRTAGIFRDASDGKFNFYTNYTPAVGATLDKTHSSYTGGTLKAYEFEGRIDWDNIYNKDDVIFNSIEVGDITVTGTQTINNTTTVSTESPLILLNNNPSVNVDTGLIGKYEVSGVDRASGVFRDASDGKFKFFTNSTQNFTDSSTIDTSATGYTLATVEASEFIGNLAWTNITGKPPVPSTLGDLSNVDTNTSPPTDGQTIVYDAANTQWVPGTASGGGGGGNSLFQLLNL